MGNGLGDGNGDEGVGTDPSDPNYNPAGGDGDGMGNGMGDGNGGGPIVSSSEHEYLYMESTLYFDVIAKDSYLSTKLDDLLDGNISLSDFGSSLASYSVSPDYSESIRDASNDITDMGIYKLDQNPHMYHFDNII